MQIRKDLITKIQSFIAASKEAAIRSVNRQRVIMYGKVVQKIFEEEQGRKDRTGYGEAPIQSLAQTLEPLCGNRFSYRQPTLFRRFYPIFPIVNSLRSQFSWTHYRTLIRIDKELKMQPLALYYVQIIGCNG
jgi:hypothetical protein